MNNQELANQLNDLLTRNYDAEAGYKEAANNVDNPQLKSFFKEQAQNRYDFGHKVKEEIKALGQEPDKGTSIQGDLHRAWVNLRDHLTSGNEALVKECVRGEKVALDDYNEFLNKEEIPERIKNVFSEQKNSIQTALNQLEHIEQVIK